MNDLKTEIGEELFMMEEKKDKDNNVWIHIPTTIKLDSTTHIKSHELPVPRHPELHK